LKIIALFPWSKSIKSSDRHKLSEVYNTTVAVLGPVWQIISLH
jgi:hypothetical protein